MADASLSPVTKICIKCGLTKPIEDFAKHKTSKDGRRGNCKSCRAKYEKEWLRDNLTQKATNIEKSRIYRQNNKERIIEQRKIYYESNKESCKKRSASNRLANLERYLERERQYRSTRRQYIYVKEKEDERYQKNKEAIKARRQTPEYREKWNKYKAENRDKFRIHDKIRRARKRSSNGRHTPQEIRDLYEKQSCKCAGCKVSIKKGYHVDHINPVSAGGSNDIGNIQLLCKTCNLQKSKIDPFQWANMNGKLL